MDGKSQIYKTKAKQTYRKDRLHQEPRDDGSWSVFLTGTGFVDHAPKKVPGVRVGAPPPPKPPRARGGGK